MQIRLQAIRKAAVEACVEPELRNAVTGSARHLVPPEVTRVADGVTYADGKDAAKVGKVGQADAGPQPVRHVEGVGDCGALRHKAGFSTVQDRVMNRLKAPYRSCT